MYHILFVYFRMVWNQYDMAVLRKVPSIMEGEAYG